MVVDDYGIRKCKVCGCFLPKFIVNECTCTKCGSYYHSEWDFSR